jgi:hypothetical protein
MVQNTSGEANRLSYSRSSPPFMEPEGSSPCSHGPATDPCSEPDASSLPQFPTLHCSYKPQTKHILKRRTRETFKQSTVAIKLWRVYPKVSGLSR